jgi:hypothetical protein
MGTSYQNTTDRARLALVLDAQSADYRVLAEG